MLIYIGLLIFIGRRYYNLALQYGKTGWLYVFLGIVSFFFGVFVGAIIVVVVCEIGLEISIDEVHDLLLDVLCIPFGIGLCWGFYKLLQSSWSKPKATIDDVLDANLIDQQQNFLN